MFALWPGDRLNFSIFINPTFGFRGQHAASEAGHIANTNVGGKFFQDMDDNKLKKYAIDYLVARHRFLVETEKEELLSGNDNIVGRIGEFIAVNFLARQVRQVRKNKNKVEKGYDLETSDNAKISVKLITAENKSGRTTRVKKPWTEFILVTLNDKYKVDRIGHITEAEMRQAVNDMFLKSEEPLTDRRMTKDSGLFDKYGRLFKDEEVKDFL